MNFPPMPISERQTLAGIFSALVLDKQLSRGAFHLWHYLYHRRNRTTGLCCPGYRLISSDIRCNIHSLQTWIDELESAGWVQVERGEPGEQRKGISFHYILCDGKGNPLATAK
jgi:DNA-binding MarR family transcriptional regulator